MAARSKKALSVQAPVAHAAASAAEAAATASEPADGAASRVVPATARERIAIIAGLRTPFAQRSTAYRDLGALDLGRMVVRELLARAELDPAEVDLVVYGQVHPSLEAPNIAREIVLGTGMPRDVQAFSVSRACATSFQAMTSAAEAMLAGQSAVAVVGGADSESDAPLVASKALARALREASRGQTLREKVRAFSGLTPRDWIPSTPAYREAPAGLRMGDSAEKMAREAGISREEQDAFAHRSHLRAAKAWDSGVFAAEVMRVVPPPAFDRPVVEDEIVRRDSAPEDYARLKPSFDLRHGTVTAGNSSPFTDGASALLMMTESKARSLGYQALGFLRSWAYAGLDPNGWMLMGPAYAAPGALDAAGARLKDMTVVDMHEAFAAQVLCNVKMLGSRSFAQSQLGLGEAVGEVDMDRFNVHGGSIAVGHPSAATGARIVTTVLHELRRRGGGLGLATGCAAGGLGAAAVLEVR
ncbi:MAG TPA: acetyl-CoA C-acyltransferase FadI [Polyangiaceae bacterium]|jgi:acetyl-CoA acyltransferase|nr:acetyl-CoA C-acyltransferase FadI [Polyangiaceae bacterium]